MKGLVVEKNRLRLLLLALMGKEDVGYVNVSGGGAVDDKEGEAMTEILGRAHLSLEGG